ncbi:MAG: 16S rRNA (cytosine(1402)-N(4))-methyltransferase RsmH [Gammaproteobacteria bacterium]|nr:16S rRNA (cytosine(1402)-N(4))-methyltransferase RsmH [Gammaproteobacteria bacterium]
MSKTGTHRPVLLKEALEALVISGSGRYVDGTFGRGGHSQSILGQLDKEGRLLAIDKDPEAIAAGRKLVETDDRFSIEQASFSALEHLVRMREWQGRINGILLDLGVSSPQLDDPNRGFSFLNDGPLDMRMDYSQGVGAAEWLATAKSSEIANVLYRYGDERFSRRIANAVTRALEEGPIETTGKLADLIAGAVPRREKGKHPATRSFQAIRIHINSELSDLEACLSQAVDVLAPGGRLVVISFHSLEDRVAKRFIRDQARGDWFPAGVPVRESEMQPRMKSVGKAVYPSEAEVAANPRARSAVMRVAERLG